MLDRKKKIPDIPKELLEPETEKIDVTSMSDREPKTIDEPIIKPYLKVHWKGDTYTYECTKCHTNIMDEDDMIIHVVKHYPDQQQNAMLEKLVKEK